MGLVVSCFETGIEYQSGRGSTKETALYALKGFFAVSLFTTVPVRLFQLSVELQQSLTAGITGYGSDFGEVANSMLESITDLDLGVTNLTLGGLSGLTSPLLMLFVLFMMGYAVVKVFFASLKRGGILLILIAVGSLYMFSIPRGYIDGFMQWCKQVIGLCLTSFLQATILTAGLMVLGDHGLLGLGMMLSAGEVPRIAGAFGLETSARGSFTGALHTAQAAINTTRTVVQVVSA